MKTVFNNPIICLTGIVICTVLAGCTDSVSAQNSVGTVNGSSISAEVLEVYSNGRYRKGVAELTDEERTAGLDEVKDIFLLASLAKTQKLDKKPEVVAQLALQSKSVLAQAVIGAFMEANPVSDDELLAEYKNLSANTSAQQFKARHILVETEDEANALIKKLDSKADFAELAKESSTGPSGPQGGDLGWFSPESMVQPFSEAVALLEDGAYTKAPVQTQFGWHVILREETRSNPPPPFDDVKEQIRPAVEQRKFQEYLDEQKAKAKIS